MCVCPHVLLGVAHIPMLNHPAHIIYSLNSMIIQAIPFFKESFYRIWILTMTISEFSPIRFRVITEAGYIITSCCGRPSITDGKINKISPRFNELIFIKT